MATTTKKTQSTAKKTVKEEVKTADVVASETVDTEKEELKRQIAEMQSQIKLMAEMMSKQTTQNVVVEQPKKVKDRMIPIINLTDGIYVLRGSNFYALNGQFAEMSFTETEAKIILSNMSSAAHSGSFYIADAEFVEDNNLEDVYQHIISDKQLKTLLNKEPSYVVDAYKSASDSQKKIIISMILDKRQKGIDVDYNILAKLSEISGVDLINVDKFEE